MSGLPIEARFPFLADYPRAATEADAWIRPHYQDYVSTVSKAAHALSLPTAIFLRVFCRSVKPKSVLDLGSGFSSFVLRTYAEGERAPVTSVDDNDSWRARTAQFLESRGVAADPLMSWEEFQRAPSARYDLIFHDLGSMGTRRQALPLVLELARASAGVVVLDDLHKTSYHEEVSQLLGQHGYRHYDLRPYTLDDYGRYAWLVDLGGSTT